jgi:hypothetical protein
MPSDNKTSKETLHDEADNDNSLKKVPSEYKKEKIISSKIRKFAQGFRIPNEEKEKKKNNNKKIETK